MKFILVATAVALAGCTSTPKSTASEDTSRKISRLPASEGPFGSCQGATATGDSINIFSGDDDFSKLAKGNYPLTGHIQIGTDTYDQLVLNITGIAVTKTDDRNQQPAKGSGWADLVSQTSDVIASTKIGEKTIDLKINCETHYRANF